MLIGQWEVMKGETVPKRVKNKTNFQLHKDFTEQ